MEKMMSGEATKLTKQKLENITLNGKPVHIFVEEEDQRQADKLHAEEVRKHSQGTGYTTPTSKYGNISGERSQHRHTISALSPEILVHVNYLFQKGGEKAVNDFLSMPTQKVDQLGPIETALKDAEDKMRFYQIEEDKARDNRTKWSAVAEQLRGALNIMTGKATTVVARGPGRPRTNGANGESTVRVSRGYWMEAMEKLLANGRTIPRQTLMDELKVLNPGVPTQNISTALSNALARGAVELLPDKQVRLPQVQAPLAAQ